VFVIDASTSIDLSVLGGEKGNFNRLLDFAATIVTDLNAAAPHAPVDSGRIRVAAVSFASDASVAVPLSATEGETASRIAHNIRSIPYIGGSGGITFARPDLGLNSARVGPLTDLFLAQPPHEVGFHFNHVIILTDGRARAPGGEDIGELIDAELEQYADKSIERWTFGIAQSGSGGWSPKTADLLTLAGDFNHLGVFDVPFPPLDQVRTRLIDAVLEASTGICKASTATTTTTSTTVTTVTTLTTTTATRCHVEVVDDDEALSAFASLKSFKFSSCQAGIAAVPDLCSPSSSLGALIKFAEFCLATCEICPDTTTTTTKVCEDAPQHFENCPRWVEGGLCATNPVFMGMNCADSCALCINPDLDCTDKDEFAPFCPGWVRCAVFDRILHSRMPLDPTHVRLKRAGV
jgi:hypothetical protein